MTFKKDLEFGQLYERIFIEHEKLQNYKLSEGKFKEYDIIDNDNNIKYEVKTDRLSHKTGNICIEYECNNKPSGINTTQADYYIYFVLDNEDYTIYKIPVEKIKLMINDKSLKLKSVKGGDGFRSSLYLFKVHLFNEYKYYN